MATKIIDLFSDDWYKFRIKSGEIIVTDDVKGLSGYGNNNHVVTISNVHRTQTLKIYSERDTKLIVKLLSLLFLINLSFLSFRVLEVLLLYLAYLRQHDTWGGVHCPLYVEPYSFMFD